LIISAFLVAFVLLIVTIYLNKRRSSSKGNSLLLVGPSDGGKTTILSQLAYNRILPTQTSMQTNASVMTLSSNKSIRVIDVPGHPRLRYQFHDHLSDAKGVGLVVDTNSVSRNAPAVAEHLHHILHALTSLPPSQSQPSLLILAHKSDLLKIGSSSHANAATLAANRVKTILERELEKRRFSQSGSFNIEGLGEEGERSDMGGLECGEKEGSTFKFDDWEGGGVVILGTSTVPNASQSDEKTAGENGLGPLQDWIENNF
jgi:signal recognition particle receptor subunit beta